jgi:alkylhydroperoxidase family enzyme
MAYLQTVSESEATGEVAELYAADRAQHGHVKNLTRAFSPRPEVFRAWVGLNTSIKQAMGLRRYEMATLGAARRLQSSYCMLAHGRTVARELLDEDSLVQLVDGASTDGLDAVDLAVMRLADKVAAIQRYVAANDTADACATLGAFINEVHAQTGKKISTAHAASFITQAQDIEAALGC